MRALAGVLVVAGILCFLVGGLLWLAARFGIPLGRLPGDIRLSGKNWSFHFPIVTCILLSLILSLILRFLFRR